MMNSAFIFLVWIFLDAFYLGFCFFSVYWAEWPKFLVTCKSSCLIVCFPSSDFVPCLDSGVLNVNLASG